MNKTESKPVEKEKLIAEKLNGRFAMLGFIALVGAYLTTGQIIPALSKSSYIKKPDNSPVFFVFFLSILKINYEYTDKIYKSNMRTMF